MYAIASKYFCSNKVPAAVPKNMLQKNKAIWYEIVSPSLFEKIPEFHSIWGIMWNILSWNNNRGRNAVIQGLLAQGKNIITQLDKKSDENYIALVSVKCSIGNPTFLFL